MEHVDDHLAEAAVQRKEYEYIHSKYAYVHVPGKEAAEPDDIQGATGEALATEHHDKSDRVTYVQGHEYAHSP